MAIDNDRLKNIIAVCKDNRINVAKEFVTMAHEGVGYSSRTNEDIAGIISNAVSLAIAHGFSEEFPMEIRKDIADLLYIWAKLDDARYDGGGIKDEVLTLEKKYKTLLGNSEENKMKNAVEQYIDETIQVMEVRLAEKPNKALESALAKLKEIRSVVDGVFDEKSVSADKLSKEFLNKLFAWRNKYLLNMLFTSDAVGGMSDFEKTAKEWAALTKEPSRRETADPSKTVVHHPDTGFLYPVINVQLTEVFSAFRKDIISRRDGNSDAMNEIKEEIQKKKQQIAEYDRKITQADSDYNYGSITYEEYAKIMIDSDKKIEALNQWIDTNSTTVEMHEAFVDGIGNLIARYEALYYLFDMLLKSSPRIVPEVFSDLDLNSFLNLLEGVTSADDAQKVGAQIDITVRVVEQRLQSLAKTDEKLGSVYSQYSRNKDRVGNTNQTKDEQQLGQEADARKQKEAEDLERIRRKHNLSGSAGSSTGISGLRTEEPRVLPNNNNTSSDN